MEKHVHGPGCHCQQHLEGPSCSGSHCRHLHEEESDSGGDDGGCHCASCRAMEADHQEDSHSLRLLGLRIGFSVLLLGLGLFLPVQNWCKTALMVLAWLLSGYDVLIEVVRNLLHGHIFDENFLMGLATIGALCIGETPEAAGVMIFFQVGELFEELAVGRSRSSIAALLEMRPSTALVLNDSGESVEMPVEQVQLGQRILVRPGQQVPLDGIVRAGLSSVVTAALTGESLPRDVAPGSEVLAGFLNGAGSLTVEVTALSTQSVAAKVAELAQQASAKKARSEAFITRFARVYTPAVTLLALLVAVVPPLLIPDASWNDFLHRGLTFLVISCPCALVVSIPLGYFAGIGGAAKKGVLFRSSAALDQVAAAKTIVLDKTGTLTSGVFTVDEMLPVSGVSSQQLLRCAATAESISSHPIAQAIRRADPDAPAAEQATEHAGMGVEAQFQGHTLYAGNRRLMVSAGISLPENLPEGTAILLALDHRYLGAITVVDALRPETAKALSELRELNFTRFVILTGDTEKAARRTLAPLAPDRIEASLLPDGKLAVLEEELHRKTAPLLYLGDGINDAPALRRADVGIAMGGAGSDAAVESADAVLMTDDLRCLPRAVRCARKARWIILENIIFALGFKGVTLLLGAMGMVPMWFAAVADVGVALVCILNATRAMRS